MPINLPAPPANVPILGTPTFDTDAGANLTWQRLLATSWNANPPLIAGDFGLGESGDTPTLTALNSTATVTGLYRVTGSFTGNAPDGASTYGYVFVERYNPFQIKQTYTAIANGAKGSQTWVRGYNTTNNAWAPWEQLYSNSGVLGPVGKTNGIPNGALFQHGSNANGEFVRFADGTQICYASGILPDANVTSATGSIWTSAEVTWNFPASFQTSDDLFVSASPRTGTNMWSKARVASFNGALIKHFSATSITSPTDVSLLAIGLWN